jgi:hypothetical protein
MFNEDTKFGFEPSVMDGTEHVFGAGMPMSSIPKSYSYRKFLPGVLDQGAESICVPCSVSAYLNWHENLETGSKKDNKINYHEIYDIRTNDGDGMTFKEAFHYLRHHGVSSKAGNLQINEYALIRSAEALKSALVMNGPCVGALPVFNFSPEFWNKMPGDNFYGYHAISFVGYNEDGFIIRNSWGTDFGNNGHTVIKYEDFNKLLEVWTVID